MDKFFVQIFGKQQSFFCDFLYRSVVTVKGEKFSSEAWEKNKRYSEQAAALVALHCLDIQKFQLAETSCSKKDNFK